MSAGAAVPRLVAERREGAAADRPDDEAADLLLEAGVKQLQRVADRLRGHGLLKQKFDLDQQLYQP